MANVALIGDSHSQALWPIVTRALERAGHTVVLTEANAGWHEAKYRQNKPDLPARLAAARPEIVVIELGANGTKTGQAYAEDVRWLVGAAKDAGARRVIWHGPAATAAGASEGVARRHEQIANEQSVLMPTLGVEWHDSRPYTKTNHRDDGVHFTMTGYNIWGGQVINSVLAPAPMGQNVWLWVGLGALVIAGAVAYRMRRDA